MKNSDIFNEKFINIDTKSIASKLDNEGFFFIENAFNKNFLDSLLAEINDNKFSVNKNWTSGVYTEKQYYVKHLLGCSNSFYYLSSS